MRMLDLFSGIGGFALAAQWCWGDELEIVSFCEIDKFCQKILKKHWPNVPIKEDIREYLPQAFHAKTYQSQEKEGGLRENRQDYGLNWQELLKILNRNGLSSKMFPDYCLRDRDRIWPKLSQRFPKSGIAWSGHLLMLNTSEWPRDAKESGLSEVLETSVPQKYWLSYKAVKGMIERSKKWGRGGYVWLQERDKDMTLRLKHLSLQRLEGLLEGTPALYGKTLILRKLTPKEKERLMGFPERWTQLEERPLEMP